MKSAKSVVLLLVALLLLVGCGETVTPEKVEDSTEKPEVKAPEVFKVGDTVKAGKIQVTLHGVRTSKGDEFVKPKEGHIFLIAEATIENISEETYAASTLLSWSANDEDGVKYTIALVDDTKGSLDGEIAPGRKLRGEVGFDVEKGKEYEIVFDPDIVGFGQVIWSVGLVQ